MNKTLQLIALLLSGLFHSTLASGQDQVIPLELRERYYSSGIAIGEVDKGLYDSLKEANVAHPARFYEICGSFLQAGLMNEAAVAYLVGSNRFRLYNKTNPGYEASGDGALAGSFAYMFGDALDEYLNQNLNNYSELARKSGEWYRDNKHDYFKVPNYDSLYHLQTKALLEFADELKNNSLQYINNLEKKRMEFEAMIAELGEVEEYVEEQEVTPQRRPTSEIPQAFLTDYNNQFIAGAENEISAVAHGWYDTYLESPDAEIIQDELNRLQYKIKPYKEGVCVIKLYGVREDGFKLQLGSYNFKVIKK